MDLVTYSKRSEIWFINLEPTIESEIKKTRPCVIISPIQQRESSIVLDQIRTVDKIRLLKKLGTISIEAGQMVSSILLKCFCGNRHYYKH